jgi:hypothetical protein
MIIVLMQPFNLMQSGRQRSIGVLLLQTERTRRGIFSEVDRGRREKELSWGKLRQRARARAREWGSSV